MAYISVAVLPANGSDKLLPPSFDKYHLLGGKVNILYLQIACAKTSCLLKKNERVSMHHTWDNNDFTTTKKVKKKSHLLFLVFEYPPIPTNKIPNVVRRMVALFNILLTAGQRYRDF